LLRPKILDYAARFLKKCDEICGIFMQFYGMKLRELSKIAGTCEKCGFSIVHVALLRHFITFPWQQGEMAALV
jgi:hypothetical protein